MLLVCFLARAMSWFAIDDKIGYETRKMLHYSHFLFGQVWMVSNPKNSVFLRLKSSIFLELLHVITNVIQVSHAPIIVLSFLKLVSKAPSASVVELVEINWGQATPALQMDSQ